MAIEEAASLEPVRTRLEWARRYAVELEEATNTFMGDGKDGTAVDYKRSDSAGRIHLTVHLPNGFPTDFGRIIGGAFHQLRAVFDNLTYQLVLANGHSPTRQTAFPILASCPDGKFQSTAMRRLKGVSETGRQAIERLQPFNEWPERPKDTVLWLIDELNNIDKHRIHHLACLWIATCGGTLYGKGVTAEQIQGRIVDVQPRGLVEDGTTLLDFRWNPALRALLRDPDLMMEVDLSAEVALRSPERTWFLDPDRIPTRALPLTHFFDAALDYCEKTILPAFAGEFR